METADGLKAKIARTISRFAVPYMNMKNV